MHLKSGFGQRDRSSTSSTAEFKKRPRYISKPLKQKAHIRAGLGPASTRHNIIDLNLETWLSVKGVRHKKVLLPNAKIGRLVTLYVLICFIACELAEPLIISSLRVLQSIDQFLNKQL